MTIRFLMNAKQGSRIHIWIGRHLGRHVVGAARMAAGAGVDSNEQKHSRRDQRTSLVVMRQDAQPNEIGIVRDLCCPVRERIKITQKLQGYRFYVGAQKRTRTSTAFTTGT
jgi:hypothetical protein